MKQSKKRGNPESSWLAARRCLAILLRLQQSPATKQQLLDFVSQWVDSESIQNKTPKAINRQFEEDKRRLVENFGIKICYSSSEKGYIIDWWERPFLNLRNVTMRDVS